jgi:hypothetical protein
VARSGKGGSGALRHGRGPAALTVVSLALAGCTTTQHEAQRERLDSARQRAALEPTRVTAANPRVAVMAVGAVRSAHGTALVVTVRNRGRRAVSDLPISIGYAHAGRSVLLNSGTGLGYFQAHLPAIRTGGQMTWVFTTGRRVPARSHLFARVGRRPAAPALVTEPGVRIALGYRPRAGSRALTVKLENSTSVPQYELQVYAYARQRGRYVAAAAATVAELGAGAEDRLRLRLVGTSNNRLRVQAVPTILQ